MVREENQCVAYKAVELEKSESHDMLNAWRSLSDILWTGRSTIGISTLHPTKRVQEQASPVSDTVPYGL